MFLFVVFVFVLLFFYFCFAFINNNNNNSIWGAPMQWSVGPRIQIPRKSYILLAMKYPHDDDYNIKFDVKLHLRYADYMWPLKEANTFDEIAYSSEDLYDDPNEFVCPFYGDWSNQWQKPCNDTGGYGPAYFWDQENGFFYLRIVNGAFYTCMFMCMCICVFCLNICFVVLYVSFARWTT